MAWCSALSPHAEVSESSVEHLEVLESVNSNDPAYRAARENRFRDFDLECQSPPHGAAAALRLRGKLRTRELVELRRLLEGDTRFSLLLDRHCKAVHELIDMKNPTPVLAVLAGLVWSSLSIAWELDTSHMPKARMKMELEELRRQLAKVLDDLSHARTRYLKELVSHREKLRRLENTEEIERLVYEEEPVMFYEPLNYLDDDTKMHVAEVIEEKLKLLLGRLQTPAPKDMKSFLAIPEDMQQPKQDPAPPQRPTRDEALDDLDEQAEQLAKRERELHIKEVQLKAQAEELLAKRQKVEGELSQRLEEAEARHAKTQMMLSEFKANFQQAQAELHAITKAAKKEWEDLSGGSGTGEVRELPDQAHGMVMELFRLHRQARSKVDTSKLPLNTTAVETSPSQELLDQRDTLQAQLQAQRKEVEKLEWKVRSTSEQHAQEMQQKELELAKLRQEIQAQAKLPVQAEKNQENPAIQEELAATRAELQKAHEELRTTGAELETALEELASTRADLAKAQEDLQEMMLQLAEARAFVRASEPKDKEMPDVLSSPDIGEVENIISSVAQKCPQEADVLGGSPVVDLSEVENIISSVAQKCPQEADVLGGSPVVDLSEVENIISDAVKQHSQELHDVSRAEAEPVMSQTTFVTDPTSVPQAGTPVREGGRVSDPNASAASAALKGENQQLRLEVGRLQRVLSELQQQLHALSQGQMMDWEQKPGQKVRVPTWSRFHLNKVHERLYLDASERQDRKRALQESIQQAREFEVLDIFRSQHPWLNATRNDLSLQMSMALSLYSASMEGGPKVRPRSAVKRCVPSPRSVQDSEPDLHEGADAETPSLLRCSARGFSSPSGEYFPLLVCSLTGDEKSQETRPCDLPLSNAPHLARPRSAGRGLPLNSEVKRKPLRPMSAASGLDRQKLQEGLRLLASKPGEAGAKVAPAKSMKRPKSVGSLRNLRCLL